jgi:transmembrane sensor
MSDPRTLEHTAVRADDVQMPNRATLDDPALTEALAACASLDRLSDADVRVLNNRQRRVAGLTMAVAAVALVGAGAWTRAMFAPEQVRTVHLETKRGQQLAVQLEDGSRLRLNGATSLDVRMTKGQRSATLAQGEAYFDIVHDRARPFVVHAGGSSTQVLGTAFDIDVGSHEIKLAVYRGRVSFGPVVARDGAAPVLVPAGWRSQFRGQQAYAPTRFDSSQQDWRQGWIDTDAMRLSDVVEALNRRGGPIVLPPPPALASLQLSGRFRLDDARQLLDAIGSSNGFQVRTEGKKLRLISS